MAQHREILPLEDSFVLSYDIIIIMRVSNNIENMLRGKF